MSKGEGARHRPNMAQGGDVGQPQCLRSCSGGRGGADLDPPRSAGRGTARPLGRVVEGVCRDAMPFNREPPPSREQARAPPPRPGEDFGSPRPYLHPRAGGSGGTGRFERLNGPLIQSASQLGPRLRGGGLPGWLTPAKQTGATRRSGRRIQQHLLVKTASPRPRPRWTRPLSAHSMRADKGVR